MGLINPDTTDLYQQVLYDGKIYAANDKGSPILTIGNSFMRTPTPATLPYESFPSLLTLKLNIGIQSYQILGMGPRTTLMQQFCSAPEALLSRKTIVILVMGIQHLCNQTVFNNIRQMDDYIKSITNSKPMD